MVSDGRINVCSWQDVPSDRFLNSAKVPAFNRNEWIEL